MLRLSKKMTVQVLFPISRKMVNRLSNTFLEAFAVFVVEGEAPHNLMSERARLEVEKWSILISY
jgi:hypothetical protein